MSKAITFGASLTDAIFATDVTISPYTKEIHHLHPAPLGGQNMQVTSTASGTSTYIGPISMAPNRMADEFMEVPGPSQTVASDTLD